MACHNVWEHFSLTRVTDQLFRSTVLHGGNNRLQSCSLLCLPKNHWQQDQVAVPKSHLDVYDFYHLVSYRWHSRVAVSMQTDPQIMATKDARKMSSQRHYFLRAGRHYHLLRCGHIPHADSAPYESTDQSTAKAWPHWHLPARPVHHGLLHHAHGPDHHDFQKR